MDPITLGIGAYALGQTLYSVYANHRQEQREDNAVQRRARDLIKAGMSPTLAAGQPASAIANLANGTDRNPFMETLSAIQAKANIAQTNAGTELAKFQSQTEQYKKIQMEAGVREIEQRIANMRSEKSGIDLRNSWINRDMASQLRLRDGEFAKVNADTLRIGQQTELLKAQTAYEQTAMDKLLTEIDNAKIMRDMNMIDRDWRTQTHQADIFNKFGNVKLMGLISGGIGSIASSLDTLFGSQLNKGDWYYPKK